MKNSAQYTKDDIQHLLPAHLPEFKGKNLTIEIMIGLTNQTYKISAQSMPSVLFQIYSATLDKKNTLEIIKRIESQEICPKFLFTCESYRIQQFIEEVVPTYLINLFENMGLFEKILAKLYKLHQIQLPKDFQKSHLYDVVFGEENNKKRINASCPQPGRQAEFNQLKKNLLEQNSKLKSRVEKQFKQKSQHYRLCHNDVHFRNILTKKTQQGDEPFLIDLDYASYNYVAYDIANILTQTCYQTVGTGYRMTRTIGKDDIQKICDLYPGKYEGIEQDVTLMLAVVSYFYSIWTLTSPALEYFSVVDLGLERWQMYKFYIERAE